MEDVNDLAREGFPVELPQDLKLLPHDAAAAEMAVQAEKAPPLQRKQQSTGGSNFGQDVAASRSNQCEHPASGEITVNPFSSAPNPMPALPELHEAGLNSIEKQGLEATKTSQEMANNEALEAQELDPQHSKQDQEGAISPREIDPALQASVQDFLPKLARELKGLLQCQAELMATTQVKGHQQHHDFLLEDMLQKKIVSTKAPRRSDPLLPKVFARIEKDMIQKRIPYEKETEMGEQ
ncbi:unnamed protein product [Miscanthus lutarioriparius]|uniref:Uncharacterized protein n=1 Tax=Miscanthus lutarioriparius TaxID=422564 RepID=A0A811S3A9_9POAL|nr:unnamed protein product [Miscanthus lutarioriparius]